jgi:Metal-dependent hydrolase
MTLRVVFLWLAALAWVRAETITIATYNVENYGAADRMTEEGYRKEYPKPEVQKAALRKVIRAVDADVWVLQEIGGAEYVRELQRDLRREGVEYPHAAVMEAADEARRVAVLSRRAFAEVVRHAELEFRYFGEREKVKRGLIEVRFETEAGDVTLFGVHLKSRYTDRADDPRSAKRREGEATAIRDAVLRRFPAPAAARFLIVGDFNDDKASRPLQRMRRRGETVIAELLPAADSRGEAWTHAYWKEDSYTRVDHVLVSPGLLSAVRGGAARIFDAPEVREASDHRPVVVTLELGK